MLQFLLALVVLVLIIVVPVMFAARMVGARNTGFGSALAAVIVSVFVGACIRLLGMSPGVTFVVSAIVGAFVLAGILGTTFWRGMAVSILSSVIQFFAFVLFLGGLLAVASRSL